MFFSSKHPKEILVLDIGTASVNAILARRTAETGLEVITSSRLGLKLLENPDFKSMWRYVKEALAGIFSAFRKDGARRYEGGFKRLSRAPSRRQKSAGT